METINRDVYLKVNTFKEAIEMSQGTDGIAVVFCFVDYDIPAGTTASVFVQKPSGKAIQGSTLVNTTENTITINMESQMTAEVGEASVQLQLMQDNKNVFTFNHPLLVTKSAVPIKSESGSPFIDEYIEKIEVATAKTEKATDRASEVSDRIEQAAQNGDYSASVRVGATVTSEPGTKAAVNNSGTTKDAVLDFTIPRGMPGISTSLGPGIFEMYVRDSDGHLILRHNDNEPAPALSIVDGHLIYTIS